MGNSEIRTLIVEDEPSSRHLIQQIVDSRDHEVTAGADDYVEKPILDSSLQVRLSIAERRIRERRNRKEMEKQLREDALHDGVTGLPNHSLFTERLDRAARRAERDRESIFAVLYLNVDDFAEVNRKLGPDGGDHVLSRIGHRLEDCVRSVDTVARIAGDEFAILLDGLNDLSDPTRVAQRIHSSLSAPVGVDEGKVMGTASVGIALSIAGFDKPHEIVRNAREVLGRAKSEGGGSHQMYDPVMHARSVARIQLETRIRSALDQDEMPSTTSRSWTCRAGGFTGSRRSCGGTTPTRERCPGGLRPGGRGHGAEPERHAPERGAAGGHRRGRGDRTAALDARGVGLRLRPGIPLLAADRRGGRTGPPGGLGRLRPARVVRRP